MSSRRRAVRRAIHRKFQTKQDALEAKPGILGKPGGTVKVPGRANYVYVRMVNQPLAEVYNARVPALAELPVLVGYDPLQPGLLQVLSTRAIARYGEDGTESYLLPTHGAKHGWMQADPVFIDLRQFMPFRLTPAGGMSVAVGRGMAYVNGEFKVISPAGLVSLSAYVPATDGYACFALISIDADGALAITVGDDFLIADVAPTQFPAAPAGTTYILGAVFLYHGQTSISEGLLNTDIVDLRFPMGHGLAQHLDVDAPTSAEDGKAIVWNDATGRFEFGEAGSGGGTLLVTSKDPIGLTTSKTKNAKVENVALNAGSTVTVIDYSGSGTVVNIWGAIGGVGVQRDSVLKIYVDGEETPSVQFDIGTLGTHFASSLVKIGTQNIGISEDGSDNSSFVFKFKIPFATGVRVDVTNPTATNGVLYAQVFYTTDWTDSRRLKSAGVTFLNHATVTDGDTYDFLDLASGAGVVVWHSLVGDGASNQTYLEGNVGVYVDGEVSPSILSSGTEDWFLSGWYYYDTIESHPWMLCGHIGSQSSAQGLDLLELMGGIRYTDGITITWDLSEAAVTTNVDISYLVLYYTGSASTGEIGAADISSGDATDGFVLTADGAGGAAWEEPPAGGSIADHDHSGDAGDGGTFDAANLTSGAATDGYVLTADGSGGAAWEPAPAGGTVDAADVTYTPTTAADWDGSADPGNVDDALDQLAGRVADVEGVGGGEVGMWFPGAAPASPSALDDEFEDSSFDTGLWTEFDPGGDLTISEDAVGLIMDHLTHAGDKIIGCHQSIPAGDFTITTRVASSNPWANYTTTGLALWENPADTSKAIYTFNIQASATGPALEFSKFTNYTTFGTGLASRSGSAYFVPTDLYLRIRRNGTTYYAEWSENGLGWRPLWSGSLDFAPSTFGLFLNNVGVGSTIRSIFAFFRYEATDIGFTGILKGARK